MIGVKIDQAKGMFFDAPKVVRSVDAATRRVLSRFGSFVRRTAILSIRKAPYATKKAKGKERTDFSTKSSQPGKPPFSQTGSLKKFIYFGYDPRKQSVVIGPTKLNAVGTAVPETLEYGGTTAITVYRLWALDGHEVTDPAERDKMSAATTSRFQESKKRITIAARPYMHPALNKELPKLPAMWRDSVKP